MFSCLQINCQPFYLCQLLKFDPVDWLIEIYLQTDFARARVLATKWYRSNQCLVLTSVATYSDLETDYCFSLVDLKKKLYGHVLNESLMIKELLLFIIGVKSSIIILREIVIS